ncbi:hypothetical protein IFM89_013477 [Coptis chinensis]|uniref:DUF7733 domain-containing protein n=1 Tax=Coptis chinensis TaxID=261450 RepID=A0A835M2G3_9MAGN|nr:hypothetical protein IFM89_013477 [Coptis chinensis]
MSGGVGPTGSDIKLPREEEVEMKSSNATNTKSPANTTTPPRRSLLNMRQLNVLAVVVVLSASGMVSVANIGFVLFSTIYMFFLSRIAFPCLNNAYEPPVFGEKNKILGMYVLAAAIIGLLLPICYIFHGIFEGDKQGIKAAAPHVFLLASQVFMEGVTFSQGLSLPIRAFVPVCYNTVRIFTIVDWLSAEIGKVDDENSGSDMRLYVGRGLAVANLVLWCFNLFGFLLPVYLPKALKKYYAGNKIKD